MPRRPKPPARRRRGSGSITILRDGSLLARVPANLDPRRPSREFPAGRRDLAEAWLDAHLHPRAAAATAEPVTLEEWCGSWWEGHVEPVRPPTTARRYLHSLRLLAPLYGTPVDAIRPSQLQALVGDLAGRLVATTVQGAVGVWRRCLEAAVDDGLVARNPAGRLTLPRPAPTAVRRHVTPAEVAALWPAIRGHRFEAAYAMMLGCGLRIGEVLGLHWSSVDLANHRAWVQHQWVDSRMHDAPKGRNPHWVRLPSRVAAALIRHRDGQEPGAVLVMQSPHRARPRRGRASPAVRPWSPTVVREDLVRLAASVDVPGIRPHDARRGLVTALLDGGASLAVVAERVGHADAGTTLKHYAGRSDEARERADRLVDAYLGDGPEDDPGTE